MGSQKEIWILEMQKYYSGHVKAAKTIDFEVPVRLNNYSFTIELGTYAELSDTCLKSFLEMISDLFHDSGFMVSSSFKKELPTIDINNILIIETIKRQFFFTNCYNSFADYSQCVGCQFYSEDHQDGSPICEFPARPFKALEKFGSDLTDDELARMELPDDCKDCKDPWWCLKYDTYPCRNC